MPKAADPSGLRAYVADVTRMQGAARANAMLRRYATTKIHPRNYRRVPRAVGAPVKAPRLASVTVRIPVALRDALRKNVATSNRHGARPRRTLSGLATRALSAELSCFDPGDRRVAKQMDRYLRALGWVVR